MMKRNMSDGRGTGVLVLLMFGIFAACVMMVLILGANSYRALVDRDEAAYRQRTGVQYISAKVRSMDNAGAVEVGDFSPSAPLPCVSLHQDIGGEDYVTRIYVYNGYLRELFCAAELDLEPESGQEILPSAGMTAALENGLLAVDIQDAQGGQSSLKLSLRGERGAAA